MKSPFPTISMNFQDGIYEFLRKGTGAFDNQEGGSHLYPELEASPGKGF